MAFRLVPETPVWSDISWMAGARIAAAITWSLESEMHLRMATQLAQKGPVPHRPCSQMYCTGQWGSLHRGGLSLVHA